MSQPAPCAQCGAPLQERDAFCTKCGLPRAPKPRSARLERVRAEKAEKRVRDVRKAGRWILAIAFLFVVGGTLMGWIAKNNGDKALRGLADRDADEVVELDDGTEKTIGELRDAVVLEYRSVFVVNYALAVIYVALYFWARKSPLPAAITALCIFLAVHVCSAIIDPTTLAQGILVKIIVVVGLVGGIRAALAERAAKEAEQAPEPTPA